MTLLIVVITIVVLIVVHEFGHFIVAKLFGVKVLEFGLGYPPRAFTFGTWRGTEYTLNWIPFGGFVRLFGELHEHGRGSLVDSPRLVQAAILCAGVLANALLAYALFVAAFMYGFPVVASSLPPHPGDIVYISEVVPGSPAQRAGLVAGDELIGIHDARGQALTPLTPESVLAYVSAHGGKAITVSYQHKNTATSTILYPANSVVSGAEGRPAIGIGLVTVRNEPEDIWSASVDAGAMIVDAFSGTMQIVWDMIRTALMGSFDSSSVVGPVGIYQIVAQASQSGIGTILRLAGFISINLVIINLLPIPILDGGRLVIVALEALIRRSIQESIVRVINLCGLAIIGILMIVVTYHDIARLLT